MDDTVLPVIRLQPGRVLLPGGIALMRVGNHEDHAVVGQNGKDNNVVNDDTTLSPLVALLESRLLGEARSEWVGLLPADVTDVTDVADAHASAATMSKSVPLEDAPGTLPSMPGSSIIGCACRVLRVDKTVIGSGSGAAYVLTVEGIRRGQKCAANHLLTLDYVPIVRRTALSCRCVAPTAAVSRSASHHGSVRCCSTRCNS